MVYNVEKVIRMEAEIPDSVAKISLYAFQDCSSLKEIEIPSSVTKLKKGIFENCSSLTSVRIPGSVVEIDREAFYNCKQLSLIVEKDSYAEQYARDREIPFTYND